MLKKKEREEDDNLRRRSKAREVPWSVRVAKYDKMLMNQIEKREDAKRLSMAKMAATQQPFEFYERDMEK